MPLVLRLGVVAAGRLLLSTAARDPFLSKYILNTWTVVSPPHFEAVVCLLYSTVLFRPYLHGL